MSLESILKEGRRKGKRKRKSTGLSAHDSKYTGEEPVWDGWAAWPVEKFHLERSRAFNFYNYYSNAKDLKPYVIEWMEANGYSKEEIRIIKKTPDYLPGVTCGTLCRCLNRGMPALHPKLAEYYLTLQGLANSTVRSDEEFVRETIANAIAEGKKIAEVVETGAAPAVSPMTLLLDKIRRTIMVDLDKLLESWMDENVAVVPLPVYAKMQEYGLPAQGSGIVVQWITKHRDEMQAARHGYDEQLAEGYSYLDDKQLKVRIDACEAMLQDLNHFKHTAKAKRAPREKKLPSATKQTEQLRFKPQDNDFKIASINPSRIPGSHRLLVFNTKNRVLYDFYASGPKGFSVKGSKIRDIDELKSRYKRLRKPEIILPIVLGHSAKQIDKAWEGLTTTEGKPNNGRTTADMVLVRLFEQP
jgi:hypothetical protein